MPRIVRMALKESPAHASRKILFSIQVACCRVVSKHRNIYQELDLSLGIKTASLLTAWLQRYRAVGVAGLKAQRKGRRPQVGEKPSAKKAPKDTQEEYVKQLEKEKLRHRIQVVYLIFGLLKQK